MERLISAFGVIVMMAIAYALCPRGRRRSVAWRTVAWGTVILFVFAFIVLKTPARGAFRVANDAVERLLGFSAQGAEFLFGPLATNTPSLGTIFAFQILPTIVFFAAFMSMLYYVGLMPWIIRNTARFIARFLGTSGAESFSTAADIFVGQTEAPLVIRPYLPTLTMSELNACMTAGFATTAGGVLAAYVGMLGPFVPQIAGHLIACSVMCAPASLVIAKLLLPEIDTPETLGDTRIEIPRAGANLLDAIAAGTTDGLKLAVNVGAMLVAFLAMVAMVNWGLGWIGEHVAHAPLSLELVLGWVFSPLAWVMGVPAQDVTKIGSLLGQKTVLNEFVAYSNMSRELAKDPAWLTERGRLIASYALCGFANLGSIGIQIGGYGGLAPSRRGDLSRLALRAMTGGLLATCMVACVAGILL
jgi:CNT family concentrative nucleoside transporter